MNTFKFKIYQISDLESCKYSFMRWSFAEKHGFNINDYGCIYEDEVEETREELALDVIFAKFNIQRPEDFEGHSLSVSDIVVFEGSKDAYYCDSFGWEKITDVWNSQIEDALAGRLDLRLDNEACADEEDEVKASGIGIFQLQDDIQTSLGRMRVDTSCIAPGLYETMIFKYGRNFRPIYREYDAAQYSTEEEAREGHKAMIAKWAI